MTLFHRLPPLTHSFQGLKKSLKREGVRYVLDTELFDMVFVFMGLLID